MMRPCIVIAGPTAAGKSEIAIEAAKMTGGEVISADSMQVYRGMNIGTAKLNTDEMCGIRHHMIDVIDPSDDFNVYIFRNMARKSLDDVLQRGLTPLVVGGTGFYIQALIRNIDFTETDTDTGYRNSLLDFAEKNGAEALHMMLAETDPEAATAIHANNIRRVIRALEYYHQTGEKISGHNKIQRQKEGDIPCLYCVISMDRQILYDRINARVDKMFEDGLEDEVRALARSGLNEDNISMKGIGYREFFPYFKGEISLDQVKERIKNDTRHYAKRQLTWFRREKDAVWYDRDRSTVREICDDMMQRLKNFGNE